jgi:hypothetical protein
MKSVAEACSPQLQDHHRSLLVELLSLAQLADPNEITQVITPDEDAESIRRELLLSGLISETVMYGLLRSLYLIDNKILAQEDAIMAIHHCKKNNVSLDDALKELGWTTPMRKR